MQGGGERRRREADARKVDVVDAVDDTDKFEGSVDAAREYFRDAPAFSKQFGEDPYVSKVYSESTHAWYKNSLENPEIFLYCCPCGKCENAVDDTDKFKGSVGAAQEYFQDADPYLSKVYSKSKQAWYKNSLENPAIFRYCCTCTECEDAVDVTAEFKGSVGAAQKYFSIRAVDNLSKVYSKRKRAWYVNSREEPGVFRYCCKCAKCE